MDKEPIISKSTHLQRMMEATQKALQGVDNGGGPFGAVITNKAGNVISCCHNEVVNTCDPTAHAEIQAIRKACRMLNTHDLHGCTLYTTCEPCSMCMSAIYWSRIDTVFYGNTREDAKTIDFDDSIIYDEIAKTPQERTIKMTQLARDMTLSTFDKWEETKDKVTY
jgi:tRNA(Arg) A34 adenosine deaminase TadA